jgi:hypothetical protein
MRATLQAAVLAGTVREPHYVPKYSRKGLPVVNFKLMALPAHSSETRSLQALHRQTL